MQLETAEIIQDEGWFECSMCNGHGETWGNGYLNVDGVALNVQFSGIGPEFGANQDFVMALLAAYRSGDLIPRDEITPQMAAEVLLGDDVNLARMAEAMHDGPLGADDYQFSIVTKSGEFCVDCIRAALTAIKESKDAE